MDILKSKISVLFFTCCMFCTNLYAQTNNNGSEDEGTEQKNSKWENQINNVIQKQTRTASEKLLLIGYNYHKEVSSISELDDAINEILADTAHIAFQNYNNYDFEIYTIQDVKNSEHDSIRTRFDFGKLKNDIHKSFCEYIKNGKTGHLIKLKWLYNGDIIYSTAIANDDKGVVFETIGYLIIIPKKEDGNQEEPVVFSTIKDRLENTASVISKVCF